MVVFSRISSFISLIITSLGVIISVTRLSVLGLWVGAEINFLGAVCFIRGVRVKERESVIKYFIVQVLGSCFIILGFLIIVNYSFVLIVKLIVLIGALIKLGVFPFHFWVPSVMSGLCWSSCFVVSVVQKFIPLWVVSNLLLRSNELRILEILSSITCVVGCLGGLGVLRYRVLLAYSSLVHLGFLLILSCIDSSSFLIYISFYFLLNACLIRSFWKLRVFSFIDTIKENKNNFVVEIWWTSLYFFSLSGLPPFSGCVLKVFFVLRSWNFIMVGCVLCILSSVISLYFYLRVVMRILIYWGKRSSVVFIKRLNSNYGLGRVRAFVNVGIGLMVFLIVGL